MNSTKQLKILFLCHGNICRSPMAEFVMRHMLAEAGVEGVEVASAALHTDEIGSDTHRGTKGVLREHSIPFTPRRAWLLTRERAREYDLLVGMDSYNLADLRRLVAPEDSGKIHSLLEYAGRPGDEVADPWYTHDFAATYRDVVDGCAGLLKAVAQ